MKRKPKNENKEPEYFLSVCVCVPELKVTKFDAPLFLDNVDFYLR